MIARARANTDRARNRGGRRPSFLVGDVAALAFPDRSFDLVVSTLSMHHWADPTAGLAEIGRVLRPGARALIWDFRPGGRAHLFGPRHADLPDPVEHAHGAPLRVVNATLALALAVHPHPADRAGPHGWVTLAATTVACTGVILVLDLHRRVPATRRTPRRVMRFGTPAAGALGQLLVPSRARRFSWGRRRLPELTGSPGGIPRTGEP
jgi:SAM-dependent methyltransferase